MRERGGAHCLISEREEQRLKFGHRGLPFDDGVGGGCCCCRALSGSESSHCSAGLPLGRLGCNSADARTSGTDLFVVSPRKQVP